MIRSTVGFSNPGTGGTGDGAQGTTGAQGAQGSAGEVIYEGTQGVQGTEGAQGLEGSGTQGVQGAVGSQGATGVQGTTGTQGTTGSQGTTGTGTQGTQGTIGANGAGGTIGYYGSFYSNADQTLNAINTEQPITFSSTYPNGANGISIIDGSKITIANPGTYTMTATIQVANSDNAVQSAEFWLKLNGQVYPSSTTNATLAPRKSSQEPSHDLMTINFVGTSTAPNDYVQIFWKGTHQGVYLDRIASNDIPESPSIVLAISQVSYQGIQGVQGSTGAQGSTGPQGAMGAQGSVGTGTQGTQGVLGSQGTQGTLGTQGTSGATASAPLTLTQTSNSASYPLTISSANEQGGGTGWVDIMKLINSKSGSSNPAKYLRMNSNGGLEIINNAYSQTIFLIADNGDFSVSGRVNGSTIGDSGWQSVSSFSNGFTAPTAVAYRKLNNVIYMRGSINGGTGNTLAFVLPEGYRPSVDVVIPVQQYGTANTSYVTVYTNGNVIPNASAGWLSSIIFPVG